MAELGMEMCDVYARMRYRAMSGAAWNGKPGGLGMRLIRNCTLDHFATRTRLIYTRDLAVEDFPRCWHLSMSPIPGLVVIGDVALHLLKLDARMAELWVAAFFAQHASKVVVTEPESQVGRERAVKHWRLPCDERWEPL